MDTPIDRAEHEEFRRRMEDEHKRINHRLTDLEDTVRQIGELTTSVHSLAQSVEPARESVGRTGKQGRGHMEKSKVVLINIGDRSGIWISSFADRLIEERKNEL